jgi:hypothetical protein
LKVLPAILLVIFVSGLAEAQTITLNPSGSNDQNAISEAIKTVSEAGSGTVYLNSGVYDIANTVTMRSNIKLAGDSNAILRVSASSQWFTGQTGVISNPDESLHDVEVCGFQIDGNIANLSRAWDSTPGHDRDCEKLILIGGWSSSMGSNISIHDMKLYNAFSDGIYIRFTDGVYLHNNLISDCQHEGYYLACCRGGSIYNNQIAGITSDCGRLDNCQNFKVNDNTFFSYDGETWGAYAHGENGLQIGDQGGSSHGYTPTAKPFDTQDIEVCNNTFANNGLKAILLDNVELAEQANVYIHDNRFIGEDELKTMGISVGNYSYENPPTVQQSEKILKTILDIFNAQFYYTGITNQTDDKIQYTVIKNNQGNIAGGIKIVGFRNQIIIDNKTYISDKNSTIVKYDATMSNSLDFWNSGIDKIDRNVSVRIDNGTAYTTLDVKMRWYSVSYNQNTKTTTKNYHTSSATFADSVKSPDILMRPLEVTGTITEYNLSGMPYSLVYVPSNGLTNVHYEYNGNSSDHVYMLGERQTKNGIEITNFTRLDSWRGNLPNQGELLDLNGTLDPEKLTVTATTPYEEIRVTHFKYEKKEVPKELFMPWFIPSVGMCIIILYGILYYWKKIFKNSFI